MMIHQAITWCRCRNLLCFAFFEAAALIGATMAVYRAFRIELIEALLIGCNATVAPQLLALAVQCGTVAVKAVSLA